MSLLGEMLDRASPMRRTVPILLDGGIRAQVEALEAQLRAARLGENDKRLGAKMGATKLAALQDQITEIYDAAEASTVKVVVHALPGTDWRALVSAYPPRKLDNGETHPDDKELGCNEDAFRRPMVEACFAGYEVGEDLVPATDDEKARLLDLVSDAQMDRLVAAALGVNRADDAVPLRRPPSLIQPSDGE